MLSIIRTTAEEMVWCDSAHRQADSAIEMAVGSNMA
jgi:hypothetical protein